MGSPSADRRQHATDGAAAHAPADLGYRPQMLTIRRALPTDAKDIATIYLASFGATYDFALAHSDAEIRDWIAGHVIAELETWVAEEAAEPGDTEVVGYIVLSSMEAIQLDVKSGRTGEGIGSQLMDQAKAQRPDGFELWTFQVNSGARRFYERHVFEAVEFGDGSHNEEGQPDVRLVWRP